MPIICKSKETLIVRAGPRRMLNARCQSEDGPPPAARKASLKQHGYVNVKNKTQRERRTALREAVAAYGKERVTAWLKRLQTFSKNKPDFLRIYTEDIQYVSRMRVREQQPQAPSRPQTRSGAAASSSAGPRAKQAKQAARAQPKRKAAAAPPKAKEPPSKKRKR